MYAFMLTFETALVRVSVHETKAINLPEPHQRVC